MRIGLRASPHLDATCQGIKACGVQFSSTYDTGCDWYLCWGWPQAEQVARDNGGRTDAIICVDAHPFALRSGDRSGARIIQLGNWGFMAEYPHAPERCEELVEVPRSKATAGGPVLVLGHVASTEQLRQGLVDVWHTPGGDAWIAAELGRPNRKYRPHPRMWAEERPQASLAEDLEGCSAAVAWNSTAAIHARMLGYPAGTIEPHGWGGFDLDYLATLAVSPQELRSGDYWRNVYRPWLESKGDRKRV